MQARDGMRRRPMHSRAIVDFLAEQLIVSTAAHERERALLYAVCGERRDVSAELWRDFGTASAPAGPRGWFATRCHGARIALPSPQLVVAALTGAIDGDLGERSAVVRAGAIAPELALVLAGPGIDAALVDAAHALLLVFALTEPVHTASGAAGDTLGAPFPARDERTDDSRSTPPPH
jgi:hypothetical protein